MQVLKLVGKWLRLFRYVWGVSRGALVVLITSTWIVGVIPGAQIALTAQVVSDVVRAVSRDNSLDGNVLRSLLLMLGLHGVSHLLGSLNSYVSGLLNLRISTRFGQDVVAKGTRLGLPAFENAESYDKLERAVYESNGGRAFQLLQEFVELLRNAVSLVSLSIALFSWSPLAALLTIISPLPAAGIQWIFARREFDLDFAQTQDQRRAFYLQWLSTQDHAAKEISVFGLGSYLNGRYSRIVHLLMEDQRRLLARREAWAALLGLFGVLLSMGAIVAAVLSSVRVGDVGQLAGFIQAAGYVASASSGLLVGFSAMYQGTLYIGNLFDFLDMPDESISSGSQIFPSRLERGVEFRDVHFSYPGKRDGVLRGVSFTMRAGECTALVGLNGAGKTTLVKLLTRLYEPESGAILVDGVPIQEFDLSSLRAGFGVIFQDFIRYELSLRENVGFGRVEVMDDELETNRAAELAGLAALVTALPDQWETILGRHFESGEQLSGGQWQKVALARAFISGAPILVLDEPTASIDALAEAELFQTLSRATGDFTSLLIAHRFSTVRMADNIVVLQEGKVVESGNHGELLAADGVYSRLFRVQARGYSTPEAE